MYRFIALDLDGTLTNSRKEVSQHTVDVLQEAAAKGTHIILASGRPLVGVMPIARRLELPRIGGYVLSYNGGEVVDCSTGECLIHKTIPMEYYEDICASHRDFDVALVSYSPEGALTEEPDDPYVHIEAKINHIPIIQVSSLAKALPEPVVKFLAVGEHEKLKRYQQFLREKYGDALNLFFSETYFLEIVPPKIEKAASLAKILQLLGGSREELIACGDGYNDITMIDYAGLGVAMENAQDILRERADYITDTNDNDGVAQVVEKFLLGR